MAARRVEVAITLDIDEDAWLLEYGCAPADLEGDVEDHAVNTVVSHFRGLGLLA